MPKTTAVFNSTGKLRRVLLGKATHFRYMPLSDVARDNLDGGAQVDLKAAIQQHDKFEGVFRQLGIETSYVDTGPELPWQSSTRDFGVNTPDGILIGRMRYIERKGEEVVEMKSLERLGETILPRQVSRGCLEGGDTFFWLDENTLVMAVGNRSTHAGYENAREILAEYGRRVLLVELLSKWNHLDIVFSPVADKLAVICEEAVPGYFLGMLDGLGWKLIKVPREYAFKTEINLLALGDDRVLSFRGNRVNELLKAHGLRVYDPEFSLFTVDGGGPHCNSFELERER